MRKKAIFWDFDGTLALRPKMFSSSLKMVLDEYEEGHKVTDEDLARWLRSGFPWQEPEKECLHPREPDVWWDSIYNIFERAYLMNGIVPEKARLYAKGARKYLIAPEYYSLYEDTLETLKKTRESGYTNIILSNHIPELPEIAESLGLGEYIELCITSARVGYEKPNPAIFRIALEAAGHPHEAWMVGDRIEADIRGAENCGIKAILVRREPEKPVKYSSRDLLGVLEIIKKDGDGRGAE